MEVVQGNSPLDIIMDSIQPRIDIIVIQMDGDVIRKEKEVHCLCESTTCVEKGKVFPLYCERTVAGKCPIVIPCNSHSGVIKDLINHGKQVLDEAINMTDKSRIIITIPCDSTDAWIVAAYDDFENVEKIEDPWRNVIAKRKYYHDVRVRGDKKSINTYNVFVEHLLANWDLVTDKCYSAKLLEQEILAKHRPICIEKDGIELVDDVGGIGGFCRMLKTIYEADIRNEDEMEERDSMLGWAEMMGWTGRRISPKQTL